MTRLSMKYLIVISMIACGLIPLSIASIVVNRQATNNLQSTAFTQLELDVLKRKNQVKDYLDDIAKHVSDISERESVGWAVQAFASAIGRLDSDFNEYGISDERLERQLKAHYNKNIVPRINEAELDAISTKNLYPTDRTAKILQFMYPDADSDGYRNAETAGAFVKITDYEKTHARYHEGFDSLVKRYEYYDLFLVEPKNGDVVYSANKEIDFGTSVVTGPFRDSGFGEAARKAFQLQPGEVVVTDLAPNIPSYGAPAAFAAAPIYKKGDMVGAIVVQMPISKFNAIMEDKEGLGESGDALIVGSDNRLRTQVRSVENNTVFTLHENHSVIEDVSTSKVHSRIAAIDEDKKDHLVAYIGLDDYGLNWRIYAEIHAEEVFAGAHQLTRTTLIIAVIAVLGVFVFALLLGRYFYRQLGGDPSDIRSLAQSIASGDLSECDKGEQAIGAYVDLVGMRNRLREILGEANDIADHVRRGAIELSDASNGLSVRTEQQAASLEETASSTEELTSTVKQNTENLRSANQLAIATRDRAVASGDISQRAVLSMQEISSASERIADIIGVINEIAFQTNLLALNAAVEAARAGEQGRGFAVVASEVRQLAGRSASAAKEIKDLIEDSTRKVQEGTGLVQESGTELSEIVQEVSKLTDIVGQISVASEEQSAGIEQINQALVSMDSVTHQNAQMVEEATTTSRDIREQASLLSERIGYFSRNASDRPSPSPRGESANPSFTTEGSNVVEINAATKEDKSWQIMKKASGAEEFWDEF